MYDPYQWASTPQWRWHVVCSAARTYMNLRPSTCPCIPLLIPGCSRWSQQRLQSRSPLRCPQRLPGRCDGSCHVPKRFCNSNMRRLSVTQGSLTRVGAWEDAAHMHPGRIATDCTREGTRQRYPRCDANALGGGAKRIALRVRCSEEGRSGQQAQQSKASGAQTAGQTNCTLSDSI